MKYELANGLWTITGDEQNNVSISLLEDSDETQNKLTLDKVKELVPDFESLKSLLSSLSLEAKLPEGYLPTYCEDISQYPTKTLRILSEVMPGRNLSHVWGKIADTIGIKVTDQTADYNLILTDQAAYEFAGNVLNFMSKDTLELITDRVRQHELDLPVLPCIVPMQDSDLDYFGDVALFIKPRRTYGKSKNKFSYTMWQSPDELRRNIVDNDFWDYQNDPKDIKGEFVIMPAIEHPLIAHSVYFSVNEKSEVLFLKTQIGVTGNNGNHQNMESYSFVDPEIQNHVRKICLDKNIRGGIYDVEFVLYEDRLVLMDWNLRPGMANSTTGRDFKSGVLVAALAHMVGLPVPKLAPFYTVQRYYLPLKISHQKCMLAKQRGIFAHSAEGFLNTLTFTGIDRQECIDALDHFEKTYRLYKNQSEPI